MSTVTHHFKSLQNSREKLSLPRKLFPSRWHPLKLKLFCDLFLVLYLAWPKTKKKTASISARGKRNQSLDLTDPVLALAAPATFPASNSKNRLLKTLTSGSSRNKDLFQADDVLVEDGSEEEAFEEAEADNAEPEDDSARKTPDVAKSSGNPSATVAGTQDQPTVSVEEISHPDEDLDSNCDLWKSCVVGYVDGKFPGYKALHDIVTNTWQCEASLTFHDSGWLVYKFNSVDDKLAVLASGPYLVYGRPLILKAMPEYFNFSYEEMTRVPVWVKFPNLPLKCWSSECLSKISSVIGKPIQCDQLTSTMSRISYARVLVELDLLDDLIHSVDIILPNGTSLTQTVIYETLSRFCRHCKLLGHAIGVCSKATVESRTMGSHADMGSTKLGTASNGLVYAVDAGVEKNKGKDVAADHYCDPMQAEVDVMSADLETVRSNKSNKFQKSKNMATVGGCSKVAVESRKKGSHAVKHAGSTMPDSVPICMGPVANASVESY
ncbi:hypothetical protein NC652_029395 [Populus alba x Populus x berolinensis]|nr:hypothetical protein NC652_029395 [Populus alba x Populus x berolinensis]